MKSFLKVMSLSTLSFLVACGGGASDPGGGNDVAADAPAAAPAAPAPAPVPGPAGSTRADLDGLIVGSGNIDTKLVPGEVAGAATTVTAKADDGTAMTCDETAYSLTKVPSQFVVTNPNADTLWPGSLVQGKSLGSGLLDPIPARRSPGTITLTIASGATGPFFKTMEAPSLSSAHQAMNEILAGYNGGTPAEFSYEFSSVYSSEQLKIAADVNANGADWSAAASLSFDHSTVKSHMLIQFSQQFFTMAFDPPAGPSGVFAKDVQKEELEPYMGAGNPPVYVGSVTYGRIFYVLFESSASQMDLEAAVKGSYSFGAGGVSGAASASWKSVINNASIKAYGVGGDAQAAITAAVGATQFDKIEAFLTKNANFDRSNPGVPISYTIRYLANATEVKLGLATEYTAKNCVPTTQYCGNGQKKDACGVCGGNGASCHKSCPVADIRVSSSNGAWVDFHADTAADTTVVNYLDGNYYKYDGHCRNIYWRSVNLVCHNGAWGFLGGQSVYTQNWDCPSDSNASWSSSSDALNFISTGYSN